MDKAEIITTFSLEEVLRAKECYFEAYEDEDGWRHEYGMPNHCRFNNDCRKYYPIHAGIDGWVSKPLIPICMYLDNQVNNGYIKKADYS